MALKMIIHYSNVEAFPNDGAMNHHSVTEVNIVSRPTGHKPHDLKGTSGKAESSSVSGGLDKSTNHKAQLPASSGTTGNKQNSSSGGKPSGASGKSKNDSAQNGTGSSTRTDNGTGS